MLLSDRVDAVLGADIGLYTSLQSIDHTLEELGVPLTLNTTDEMIAALQQAVKTMKEDGTISATKDRYMFRK